jgi:hypothetical protein
MRVLTEQGCVQVVFPVGELLSTLEIVVDSQAREVFYGHKPDCGTKALGPEYCC